MATDIDDTTQPTNATVVDVDGEIRQIKAKLQLLTNSKLNNTFTKQVVYPAAGIPLDCSGAVTINLLNGTFQNLIITGDTTFTFDVPEMESNEGVAFTLRISGGGNFSITWPAGILWPGGVAPTLTLDGLDYVTFTIPYEGANPEGTLSMADVS